MKPHIALIRRFQPYRRDPRGLAMRNLRSMSDMDKHRVLVPAVMGATDVNLELQPINCAITEADILLKPRGTLKPGTPVARAVARYQAGGHEVHMKGKIDAEPTLGRGYTLSRLLGHIEAVVFELLDSFDRLTQGSHYEPAIPALSMDLSGQAEALRGLASTENDQA